jgi:hypothetical protein
MARSAPTFYQGSEIAGADIASRLFDAIVGAIQTHTSGGVTAWETWDDLQPTLGGYADKVFRSLGDRNSGGGSGDATLYPRLRCGGASNKYLYIGAYRDECPADHTARNEASGLAIGDVTDANYLAFTDGAEAATWYVAVNSHAWIALINYDSAWHMLYACQPRPTHLCTSRRGVVRPTAAYNSGASVAVSIDRDETANIVVGQTVICSDYSTAGAAIAATNTEACTVEAITSTTITLATVANNHVANGIIGADPTAFCIMLDSGASINMATGSKFKFTDRPGGSATNNDNDAMLYASITGLYTTAPSYGTYQGVRGRFAVTSGTDEYRGDADLLAFWRLGDNVLLDDMVVNDDTDLIFQMFPALVAGTNWVAGIGPGASYT